MTDAATTDAQIHTETTPWRVTFSRRLAHRPAQVWAALTESEHLDAWFPTRILGDRVAGARLRFEFRNGEGPDFDGTMLVFDPPEHLAFRWGQEVLRFDIRPDGQGCVLDVDVAFDDTGVVTRDTAGWHVCLDNLAIALAGEKPGDGEPWKALQDHYMAIFPAAASATGPPDGW